MVLACALPVSVFFLVFFWGVLLRLLLSLPLQSRLAALLGGAFLSPARDLEFELPAEEIDALRVIPGQEWSGRAALAIVNRFGARVRR